jgi:predicted nucleotidyltransferase
LKSEDIIAILDHHKHRIFDIFYVDNIGLFGSYIRDEHIEENDIRAALLYAAKVLKREEVYPV